MWGMTKTDHINTLESRLIKKTRNLLFSVGFAQQRQKGQGTEADDQSSQAADIPNKIILN
jgi:hypothetical protein